METSPPTSDTRSTVGCDERLQTLFEELHGELLGTLFYVVGNMEDARDAMQETFLKCWRHRQQMEKVENLRAWVFRDRRQHRP